MEHRDLSGRYERILLRTCLTMVFVFRQTSQTQVFRAYDVSGVHLLNRMGLGNRSVVMWMKMASVK